ncbi:hypothetical protein Cni_G17839 [Canna indica]|uniref:K Homology domain-containing protein n=1 Tax=Canna indica TaxID=4628 RepID=A0AAQ3KNE0_9LILI|nr:hypothetical protein Cni_G17839 [Canna indica]
MADDLHYSSRPDNKRKFDDPAADGDPSPPARRPTGFSAPIASTSPDGNSGGVPPAQTYNSVAPPLDGIQLAKQRAQEIAARLFSDAESKRPRLDNGGGEDDSRDKDSALKSLSQTVASQVGIGSQSILSYGYQSSSKKIEIPNGRVGVIIGKSGETIKYLQLQSGAKIQVTRDMDADPNSQTRSVELVGTSEQIIRAEQLINDVLAEAEAGASGIITARKFGSVQAGAEQFQMKVPNNKVGLVIGKGGESIKNMQAKSGARIQVIPLHLPPGDTSTERTVYIDGTKEQIEAAKQLVNEVISENRVRNPAMAGGYLQQSYHAPPPTSWGPPGAPMHQPGYGYMAPGAYPGAPPQYNTSQAPYGGYPPPASTGFSSGWDQTSNQPQQQTAAGTGYDYYNQQSQQPQQPQGGTSAPAGSTAYNYGQPVSNYNNQVSYGDTAYSQASVGQQGYGQDGYTSGYNSQQGYGSTPGYGTVANPSQDGSGSGYGAQGGSTQAPSQQPPSSQSSANQVYAGQPPNSTGYGNITPTSQPGYGSQPPAPTGYGQAPSYGQPHVQKPQGTQAAYGQSQQVTSAPGGYIQSAAQPEYGQPPPSQSGYGHQQPYGASQPTYGQQQQQLYNESYSGSGYSQPPAYDSAAQTTYDASAAPPAVSSSTTGNKAPAT